MTANTATDLLFPRATASSCTIPVFSALHRWLKDGRKFRSAEQSIGIMVIRLRFAARRQMRHEPHPALWAVALMSIGGLALLALRLSGY